MVTKYEESMSLFFSRKPTPPMRRITAPVEGDHVHFDVRPHDVSIPDDLTLDYVAQVLQEKGQLPPTYANLRRDGQEQTAVYRLLAERPTLKEFDALGLILESIPGSSIFDRMRGVNPAFQIRLTEERAREYRGDRQAYFDAIKQSVREPNVFD